MSAGSREAAGSFEVYDIHTDSMRPMTGEDLDVLQEVYKAYGQVREVVGRYIPDDLVRELEEVHERLKERMRERGIIDNVSA